MKRQLSVTSRQELMDSLRARYRSGSRVEKCRILDEFVAVTGYHRKHAIRLLRLGRVALTAVARARPRRYGNAVAEALVVLWEASDRVCGKRLKALIPTLLDALERHGHLQLHRDVRMQVLSASAATIDRLLVLPRSGSAPRRRRSTPTTAIRRRVPVRTFADWGEPVPGFVEADLVAHSGERASGSFAQTLTLTDVASGWTECVALVVRDGALVTEALTKLCRIMPFQLRGVDTDNVLHLEVKRAEQAHLSYAAVAAAKGRSAIPPNGASISNEALLTIVIQGPSSGLDRTQHNRQPQWKLRALSTRSVPASTAHANGVLHWVGVLQSTADNPYRS